MVIRYMLYKVFSTLQIAEYLCLQKFRGFTEATEEKHLLDSFL